MKQSNFFHKHELINKLNNTIDKTLGEVDVNSVFDKTKDKPKITGIAGDVIEQSVLGYPPDGDQRPDLNVDGTLVELKTTGMRKKKNGNSFVYEAKEPASITAVSIGKIEDESFYDSSFWKKVENTLFVFYEYESDKTVNASDYMDFHIRGYVLHSFKGRDLDIVKRDWQLIHDYLLNIRENYSSEDAKKEYPNLSTIINKKTVYLDTAPKYPNPPRFRIRRRVISSIIQEVFKECNFEKLPDDYQSYEDVIIKCSQLTQLYAGLSICDLLKNFGITNASKEASVKQYSEQVIVRMFGGKSKKLSKIELFNKFGIVGKSITLTKNGSRTEDMKLFSVDFDDFSEVDIIDEETGDTRRKTFEDSELYSYLTENKLLCIIFQEHPDENGVVHLEDNIFVGFKWIDLYSDEIISAAKQSWEKARNLVVYDELKIEPILLRDGSPRRTPKTNIPMTATNLPKSKDYTIFFRGTGADAKDKVEINGLEMLRQDYWMKGKYLADELSTKEIIAPSNIPSLQEKREQIIEALKNK